MKIKDLIKVTSLSCIILNNCSAKDLEDKVQKKLRKQDPWIEEVIVREYSENNSTRGILDINLTNLKPNYVACYSSFLDTIFLPIPHLDDAVESLDHELWHAIYDEILTEKDRLAVKNHLEHKLETDTNFRNYVNSYQKKQKEELNALVWCTLKYTIFSKNSYETNFIKAKDIFSILSSSNILSLDVAFRYSSLLSQFENIKHKLDSDAMFAEEKLDKNDSLEDISEDYLKKLMKISRVKHSLSKLVDTLDLAYSIFSKIKERKTHSPALERVISSKINRTLNDNFNEIISISEKRTDEEDDFSKKYVSAKTPHPYLDPNEFLARLYESMYTLYFGKVTFSHLTLSDDDLLFFTWFKHGNKPMFSKGIEKYRLAKEMISDGMDKETVKKELEYAKSYSYAGKNYFWPESKIKIKGELKVVEDSFAKVFTSNEKVSPQGLEEYNEIFKEVKENKNDLLKQKQPCDNKFKMGYLLL